MSNILEIIRSDMIAAMKQKDVLKRDILRLLVKEFQEAEINAQAPLNEEASFKVIDKMIKMLKESIADLVKAGAEAQAETEQKRISIIESYLPSAPSEQELCEIADRIAAQNQDADFGKLMGLVKNAMPARADLKFVSSYLRTKINEK